MGEPLSSAARQALKVAGEGGGGGVRTAWRRGKCRAGRAGSRSVARSQSFHCQPRRFHVRRSRAARSGACMQLAPGKRPFWCKGSKVDAAQSVLRSLVFGLTPSPWAASTRLSASSDSAQAPCAGEGGIRAGRKRGRQSRVARQQCVQPACAHPPASVPGVVAPHFSKVFAPRHAQAATSKNVWALNAGAAAGRQERSPKVPKALNLQWTLQACCSPFHCIVRQATHAPHPAPPTRHQCDPNDQPPHTRGAERHRAGKEGGGQAPVGLLASCFIKNCTAQGSARARTCAASAASSVFHATIDGCRPMESMHSNTWRTCRGLGCDGP